MVTAVVVSAAEESKTVTVQSDSPYFIFMRSGDFLNPTEVYRSDIGKFLVCPVGIGDLSRRFLIVNETFTDAGVAVLVRCWKGKLHIGKNSV